MTGLEMHFVSSPWYIFFVFFLSTNVTQNLAKSIPALRHYSRTFPDIPSHSYFFYSLLSPPLSSLHHSVHSGYPLYSSHHFPASLFLPIILRFSPCSIVICSLFYHMFHCFLYSVSICSSPFLAAQLARMVHSLSSFDLQTHFHFQFDYAQLYLCTPPSSSSI